MQAEPMQKDLNNQIIQSNENYDCFTTFKDFCQSIKISLFGGCKCEKGNEKNSKTIIFVFCFRP